MTGEDSPAGGWQTTWISCTLTAPCTGEGSLNMLEVSVNLWGRLRNVIFIRTETLREINHPFHSKIIRIFGSSFSVIDMLVGE